jgi:hypothetical protein
VGGKRVLTRVRFACGTRLAALHAGPG